MACSSVLYALGNARLAKLKLWVVEGSAVLRVTDRFSLERQSDLYSRNLQIRSSCTIAPACADRSGGPPKPGAAYENQPAGVAGGPSDCRRGPMRLRRARGDAVACPGSPNINCAPTRDSRATCRMTTSPELRWKAHIFLGRKPKCPKK